MSNIHNVQNLQFYEKSNNLIAMGISMTPNSSKFQTSYTFLLLLEMIHLKDQFF